MKNTNIDGNTFNSIKDYIKSENNNIKIIICSSINNKDIGSYVINTIKKYHGNPKELDEFSQNDYFYFPKLLNKDTLSREYNDNENIMEIYKLFNYIPKYISQISKIDFKSSLDKIKKRIIDKIKLTPSEDIFPRLIYFLSLIGNKYEYSRIDILTKINFKYYLLDLLDDGFRIDYQFPFIEYISEDTLHNNVDNYFKEKNILNLYIKK